LIEQKQLAWEFRQKIIIHLLPDKMVEKEIKNKIMFILLSIIVLFLFLLSIEKIQSHLESGKKNKLILKDV
jgi:hypothetical protein